MKHFQAAAKLIGKAVECYISAEILWYYTHDGETLRAALAEWWEEFSERVDERSRVRRTLNMIRDLPE